MSPPRSAQRADPPSAAAPTDPRRSTTAGQLAARRPPDLFAREPVSEERLLQHGVIRAFRARVEETLDCYEPVLCRDAEPPRVGVRFVVGEDGRVSDARLAFITEYHRAPETRAIVERPGDPDGELARCLLAVTRRITVALPPPVPAETSFVFGVDTAGCPH